MMLPAASHLLGLRARARAHARAGARSLFVFLYCLRELY